MAREDLEIGGRRIGQGQVVHLVLAAANRDPAHFDEPDGLDVSRWPNKHLAFAQGIHYCLGAPLARLEGQIALQSVLDRCPDLRLASPDKLDWILRLGIRGPKALPIVLRPAAAKLAA